VTMANWLFGSLVLFVSILLTACSPVKGKTTGFPSNVTMIIRGYGYPCEDHVALTPDGYYLSIQRIPHGLHNANAPRKGVVFFQHGLVDNSNGITLNPPGEGLPFILADAGYDVWLGNNRGNGYSMTHIKYNTNQAQFWQFSWDEMAKYDLPTHINYVLARSGASSLTYIGHSEGTTQAFAGFSINHNLASKVNLYVALAPVTYVVHQKALLFTVMAKLDVAEIILLLGGNEFALGPAVKKLIPGLCIYYPEMCNNILEVIMGPSFETNVTRMPYYLTYEPNPSSTWNMIHWSQMVDSGEFKMLDWGHEGNMKHYNQSKPPFYHLSNLPKTLPIAIFAGGNDYLADPTDVARLVSELPVPPVFTSSMPTYSHTDFIWAENAYKTIYPQILSLLAKYNHK
jgi:lysosomal acid lipase/cholesteryl ester hydrolase